MISPRKRNRNIRSFAGLVPNVRGFITLGAVPTMPMLILPPGSPTYFPPSYIYIPTKCMKRVTASAEVQMRIGFFRKWGICIKWANSKWQKTKRK